MGIAQSKILSYIISSRVVMEVEGNFEDSGSLGCHFKVVFHKDFNNCFVSHGLLGLILDQHQSGFIIK